MPSKQHLDDQFEKLLARRVLANSLMGVRTKAWKGSWASEDMEDEAAAPAAIKPTALGKRVRERGSAGDLGVDQAGE